MSQDKKPVEPQELPEQSKIDFIKLSALATISSGILSNPNSHELSVNEIANQALAIYNALTNLD
jgi:hypothetical protein